MLLLSFVDGGYFPGAWPPAITAFLTAAALAAVLGRRVVSRPQALCAAGMAGLAGWTALSTHWSPVPEAAWPETQRTLVYVAAIVAAALVGGSILRGVLAGVALVCAYAVGQRLLQGPPNPPDPIEGVLLQAPLGYANALGALAAIGVAVIGGWLVRDLRRRLPGAVLLGLFVATLVLSESRGGWLAASVGLTVALALESGRVWLARGVALASVVLLGVALALPAGGLAENLAARGGDRTWYWNVAWQEAADSPLLGRGAGTFELAWLERQPVDRIVVDAHSLYLEALAELGVVGLILLALALAPPLVLALRHAYAPAAAGGYVAFLLHAGIDWDWEMPAVTVAGLLCGSAILLAHTRGSRKRLRPSPTRSVIVISS